MDFSAGKIAIRVIVTYAGPVPPEFP